MKIRIMIIALLSSVLVSCENYFDLERNRPDLPEWQSVNDLTGTLTTTYKTLLSNGGWGNVISNVSNYTELVHDLGTIHPGGSWAGAVNPNARTYYPFDYTNAQLANIFSRMYIAISCSNTLISFIEEVNAGNIPIMSALSHEDAIELKRINGEAHFMRGYAYYLLSLVYMPPYSTENSDTKYLPYIVNRYYSPEELLSPPIGTMGMVYDLMISDFTTAKSELIAAGMSDETIQSTHRGYTNKYAASAMLMRLNFVQGNWNDALTECEFIENGPYDLSEQPIRAFNRSFNSAAVSANEVIFDALLTGVGGAANAQPALNRITKVGNWGQAKNKKEDYDDPNWVLGGRGSNWLHNQSCALHWNTQVLRNIGWAEPSIEDPTNDNKFQLTTEALSDRRCVQLSYYLKSYKAGGDKTVHEMQYTNTTWDALWNDKYLRGPQAQFTQLPLIRFAEVLLTKASCLVQSGGDNTQALTAINTVRERAFGDASHNLSGTITESMIETERIKELSFEIGDRLLYLAAMKRDIPTNGKKVDPSQPALVPVIPYPYDKFHIQVPEDELNFSSTGGEISSNY